MGSQETGNTANFIDQTSPDYNKVRLVGLVTTPSKETGYLVYSPANGDSHVLSKTQLRSFHDKIGVSNLTVNPETGVVGCTECSISRLMQFGISGATAKSLYVLGEIEVNNVVVGYRVLNSEKQVADIKEDRLMEMVRQGYVATNFKLVVGLHGKRHISAIMGQFPTIVRVLLGETEDGASAPVDSSATQTNYYKNYLTVVISSFFSRFRFDGVLKPNYFNTNRKFKMGAIFLSEVVIPTFPELTELAEYKALPANARNHAEHGGIRPTREIAENLSKLFNFFFFIVYHTEMNTLNTVYGSYKINRFLRRKSSPRKRDESKYIKMVDLRLYLPSRDSDQFITNRFSTGLKKDIMALVELVNSPLPMTKKNKIPVSLWVANIRNFIHEYRYRPKQVYTPSSINFYSDGGFELMGVTRDERRVGEIHQTYLYGRTKLISLNSFVFYGTGDQVTEEQKNLILSKIECYGDARLTRQILSLHNNIDTPVARFKYQFALTLLHLCSNPLYTLLDYIMGVDRYLPKDANQFRVTQLGDLGGIFFASGMLYGAGANQEIPVGTSIGRVKDLSRIPERLQPISDAIFFEMSQASRIRLNKNPRLTQVQLFSSDNFCPN